MEDKNIHPLFNEVIHSHTKLPSEKKYSPITLNELRIGNLVRYNTRDVQVTELRHDDMLTTSEHVISGIEHFLGIPLSPEILEKAGFEFMVLGPYPGWYIPTVNGDYVRILAEGVDAFCYSVSDFYAISISSLHQLQNLYFCLVGKELNINL